MSDKPTKNEPAKAEKSEKSASKASPASKKKAPAKKAPKKSKAKARPADGVELARLRRLERWGCKADRCALLGTPLDVGPRAGPWQRPLFDVDREEWVCSLARDIVDAAVPPEALELAAGRLADRSDA